jgi:hypothetical protein
LYKPQHKDEISLGVMVKNYTNWIISSQAPNRRRFKDYYVHPSGLEAGDGNKMELLFTKDIV